MGTTPHQLGTDRIPHTRFDRDTNGRRQKPRQVLRKRLRSLLLPPPPASSPKATTTRKARACRGEQAAATATVDFSASTQAALASCVPASKLRRQFRFAGFYTIASGVNSPVLTRTPSASSSSLSLTSTRRASPTPSATVVSPRTHTQGDRARALPQRVPPSQTALASFHRPQRPPRPPMRPSRPQPLPWRCRERNSTR